MSDKTKKPLKNYEVEITDLKDKLARSLADYSNLEKRIDSQRQLLTSLAVSAIITQFIDVLDDFYRAQEHLNDPGLKMAIDKFTSILHAQGMSEVKADGQEFNPQTMDCVEVAPGKQNHVVSVRRRGYLLGEQILRPAQVVVGKEESKVN